MNSPRRGDEPKPIRNRLLLSIPEAELLSIRSQLEFINLPSHLCLHEPHQRVDFLYFPNEGVVSLVVVLKDGKSVEAGLLGNDGVVGLSAIRGLGRSPLREVVQIAGDAHRIRAAALMDALPTAPALRESLDRFAAGLAIQVAQTAACNRFHNVEHRLSRWLLMAHDRIQSDVLPITHDFLATMLGTDRSSISLAANILQKSEMIQYRRGSVSIVGRKKLEEFTCECYASVQRYTDGKREPPSGST